MNTFQKMIGASLLIVSLSVSYYFVIYLPKKEGSVIELQKQKQTSEQNIVNKKKCQKDASEYYAVKQNKASESTVNFIPDNESYSFNSEFNTCLLAWVDILTPGNGITIYTHHITDIYTNNDIYKWQERSTTDKGKIETILGIESEYNKRLQSYGLY